MTLVVNGQIVTERFHAQANDREVLLRIAGEHHPRPLDVFLFVLTDDAVALRVHEMEQALDARGAGGRPILETPSSLK